MSNVLEAYGIQKSYAGRSILSLDAVTVAPGEVVAVLGPNGAGKSTLFRILLLLERPDAGELRVAGLPARVGDVAAGRRLAGVFQRPFLFRGTVQSNVAFGLHARGVATPEAHARSAAALDWLEIAHLTERDIDALSGGEAQRVALARALVLEPEVVLLDEPTSNLDITAKRRFRDDLERILRSHARSAVIVTHDASDAFALADRVVVLEAGRIVQEGRPEALVLEPATPFVAAFSGAELLMDGRVVGLEEQVIEVDLGSGVRLAGIADPAAALQMSPGRRVHVAYRPEDVLISPANDDSPSSARNRLTLRITSAAPSAGSVRLRLDGDLPLVALVTRQSAEMLELRPGRDVVARIKATAVRVLLAAGD